jgi:hypothetical protein
MPNSLNFTNVYGTKSITLDQYPPESWEWLAGEPDGADKADVKLLSESVPWLYRGLNILVQAVASVPVCMVKGKKDIGYLGADDLNTPFPYAEDLPHLIRSISASLILEGRGYLFRDQAKTMQATKKLWYWSPLSVTFDAKKTRDTKEISFTRRVDGHDTPYTAKEVIYFWPEDTYIEIGPPQSSPAKAALCAAGVLYNVDQYVAAYFKRGAIKAMLLSVKGMPPKDEKAKLEKWWKDMTSGIKRAFNIFTLNAESVTPTVIGDGLEGLQDSELTKEKREDISTALGIPQSILFSSQAGGLGGAGVMSEDTYRFYNMTVVPLADFLVNVLNKQQFKDTGYRLEVRNEEMDVFQEDEVARAAAVSSTVTALADPELFLIAAAIQGYDLSEKVMTQIDALIAKKEEAAKQIQKQLANKPATPPDQTPQDQKPPAQDQQPTATNKAMEDDLARLRRKAIKNIGKLFSFESENIPNLPALLVQLNGCKCEDEVKAIIGGVTTTTTPAPAYEVPTDAGREILEAMRIELEALKYQQPAPNVNISNYIPKAEPVINVPASNVTVTNEVQPTPITVEPAQVSVEVKNDNEPQREYVKRIRKIANGKE